MNRFPWVLPVALLLMTLFPGGAAGELGLPGGIVPPFLAKGGFRLDGPVGLSARNLSFDEDTGVAVAEGDVELSLGGRTMRADRIRYDSRTGEADLSGKVRYKDADEEFSFDRITINLDSETGVLYNGSIRISTNNYLIASQKIAKTGKETFLIEKGTLTTCPCDPEPDWKFEVRRSRVVLDEYAYARDITFRVRGVPVLWLPYGAFPVKLTRQSGLLLPSFSHDRSKGSTLTVPYYWSINRWSDATITVDAMSRRGYRPEGEYRYVLNRESDGVIRGTFFRDKEAEESRWRLYGENIFRSGDWTINGKLELPSDDRYYVDLLDSDNLRSARTARSAGFAGRSWGDSGHAVHVTWNKDLQGFPVDNTVQRLPEYTMTLLPRATPLRGADLSGEFSAGVFRRESGGDEQRGRGFLDLSRTLFLHPSITLTPFFFADFLGDRSEAAAGGRVEGGRIVPGGGAEFSLDARKDDFGGSRSYVHAVRTSLAYRYVPRVRQEDIAITDRWSRIAPQSQFVLTAAQRLLSVKDGAFPREVASLNVQWAVDVGGKVSSGTPYVDPLSPFVRSLRDQVDTGAGRKPRGDESISDVYANFTMSPYGFWAFHGEALFDPVETTFIVGALGGEWKKDADHRVLAEYRMSRDLAEDLHGLVTWRLLRFLRVQAQANYSMRNRFVTDGSAGLTLFPRSDCWTVGFVAERKSQPADTSLKLTFGLKGIGSTGK